MRNRTTWLIAIAVVLVIAAFGTWAYLDDKDERCLEWQRRYHALERPGHSDGVFDFINIGPEAALRDERPAGCTFPKGL